jgi:hypothetical protein
MVEAHLDPGGALRRRLLGAAPKREACEEKSDNESSSPSSPPERLLGHPVKIDPTHLQFGISD